MAGDVSAVAVDLVTAMQAVPRELRGRVRPALTRAARPILADAQARASWSSRVPRSLQLRVQLSGQTPGVRIVARRSIAPHARAYEGLQRGARFGYFRQPVFRTPTRDLWVQQRTRPFLTPAVAGGRERVLTELGDALMSSAAAAGWRVT